MVTDTIRVKEKNDSQKKCESGFSMLEVVVTLSITFILAAYAIPNVTELRASFNRQAGLQQVEFDFRRARAEAVAQGVRTIIVFNEAGNLYGVGKDSLPFSNDLTPDEVLFQRLLPNGVSVEASTTLAFDTRGLLIDEDGVMTSANVTLRHNDSNYCQGNIYGTGNLELNCNEEEVIGE